MSKLGGLPIAFFVAVATPLASVWGDDTQGASEMASVQGKVSSPELTRFVLAHLPLTDLFEAERRKWVDEVPRGLKTDDFHMARFPRGKERVTIAELNDALEGCVPDNRLNGNSVSITIHYSCEDRKRSRLVYNFRDGRIKRVLVGDIPQELRCVGNMCIDVAEKELGDG